MKLFSFGNKKPWQKFYNKNEREVNTPDCSLYHYLFESNQDHLDNIAINYFNNKTSYNDFFNQIDICAKALISQGIRKDDVVSICMPNTPEAVVMFYAVSKIGAVSNMIHPLSAEEEIKRSIIETKSVMLLTVNFNYKKIVSFIDDTNVYKVILSSPRDSMPFPINLGYFLLEDRKVKLPSKNEKFMLWNDFYDNNKDKTISLNIPDTVKYIHVDAFSNCCNIKYLNGNDLDYYQDLAYRDLDRACLEILEYTIGDLTAKGRVIDKDTLEARDWVLNKIKETENGK